MNLIKNLLSFAVLSALTIPQLTQAAPVTTENANITAIFGTGNPNTGWQQVADSSANLILGLRAKDRTSGATPNDGAGTYSFASGSTWQIEFSVNNTGASLLSSTYKYLLQINGSPVDLSTFPDNAYGTSATANGAGTVGTFATEAATHNIMQNSERNSFGFINDTADGTYTFELDVKNVDGVTIDSDTIHVQVGSVPDSGTGIAGLGIICALLWAGKKYSVRAAGSMRA